MPIAMTTTAITIKVKKRYEEKGICGNLNCASRIEAPFTKWVLSYPGSQQVETFLCLYCSVYVENKLFFLEIVNK